MREYARDPPPLYEQGIPVILISHTMHDVMAVADRMVIMRRGKVVANIQRAEASEELIVRHIVGSVGNGESAAMI